MNPLEFDLYHLGFCGQILYLLRFAIQWIASEKQKKSVVPLSFWTVSFLASAIMIIHYLLQAHLPLSSLQLIGCYIAARNWSLMRKAPKKPLARYWLHHFVRLGSGLLLLIVIFALARHLQGSTEKMSDLAFWITSPNPSSNPPALSWQMHLFGMVGAMCLAVRFWIQWALAEGKGASAELGAYFWVLSLVGSIIVLFYSWQMNDEVTAFGPLIGLVMYSRNLMLIAYRRAKSRDVGP